MNNFNKLILASNSEKHIQLLLQIGIKSNFIKLIDLDQTPLKKEKPKELIKRLVQNKTKYIIKKLKNNYKLKSKFYNILISDTIVSIGRKILNKPNNKIQAYQYLSLLSGKTHKILTSIIAVNIKKNFLSQKTIETRVKFKHLSYEEIHKYIATNEWENEIISYNIQGFASVFIISIIGSYTNIIGLPLFETTSLLRSIGIDPIKQWLS